MKMLWLLVVTVAAAAIAASPSDQVKTIYEEGKEYMYNYESQVLSGMPVGSNIYSGLKIKAEMRFQKISTTEMKMEMMNPRFFKVNGAINENNPTEEMLPDEVLTEFTGAEAPEMKTKLMKPVKFSYERGHVEDLVTEQDDSEYSVNVKKGILSMLEVNFNDRHSLSPDVDVTDAESKPRLYRVVEPSVSGECETAYRLWSHRSMDGTPSMTINKVRNFNKCVEKFIFTQSMLNGQPCYETSEIVSAQSGVRYSLLGSPDEFIIVSAVAESQYNIVPYAGNQGRVSTLTNQTLMMTDSRPITDQIPDPSSPSKAEASLKAKVAKPQQRKIHRSKQDQQETVKMVMMALTGIDKMTMGFVQGDASVLLRDLHRLLETLDEPSLKSIYTELDSSRSKQPRAWQSFMDVLRTVNTDAAVDFLLKWIETSSVSSNDISNTLMAFGILPHPDIPIVKRLMEFITKMSWQNYNPMVKRTAYLSLASLGYKLMNMNATEIKDLQEQQKVLKMLSEESNERGLRVKLRKELNKVSDSISQTKELYMAAKDSIIEICEKLFTNTEGESRMLALKTMGGLRFPEFMEKFTSIVENRESPILYRLEAISGLKQLAAEFPMEVQKVLLPIYFDQSEEEEVRGLAVIVAITSGLPMPELEMIGRSIWDEPSEHVSTLVSSILTELSKFTIPCQCFKPMSLNSSLAMNFAKTPTPGIHLSKMVVRSTYSKDLEMGRVFEQVFLYSSKERMPRAAALQWTSYSQYSAYKTIEIGYTAKGMDGVLEKVLTDSNVKSMVGFLKKLLLPQHDDRETDQEIKNLKEKIEVKPRSSEPFEGYLFVKLFGQEVAYFDFKSFFPQGPIRQPEIPLHYMKHLKGKMDPSFAQVQAVIQMIKNYMNTQQTIVLPLYKASLPTETGLPLFLFSKMTGVYKMAGDLRASLDPNVPQTKPILSRINTEADFTLSGVFDRTMDMTTQFHTIQSGISAQINARFNNPSQMNIHIDPEKYKFTIKMKDVEKLEMVRIVQRPMVWMRMLPEMAENYPSLPEETEITLLDDTEIHTVYLDAGEYFGRVSSLVSITAIRRDNGWAYPTYPMNSGKKVVSVMFDPQTNKGELNLQFAYVPEKVSAASTSNQEESRSESSWWPFWQSSPSDSEPAHVSHEDSDDTIISDKPAPGFIDLDKEDLTMDYLLRKFREDTEILNTPYKSGYVVRMWDTNSSPPRALQISTLTQREEGSSDYVWSAELRTKPLAGEQKDLKIIANFKCELPTQMVEPSDLNDNEYQQSVEQQIQETSSDPMDFMDTLLELKDYIFRKDILQLDSHKARTVSNRLLDSTLNYLLDKYVAPYSSDLKDLVLKQRVLSRDISQLKKQEITPKNKDVHLQSLKKLLDQSKSVSKSVSDKLDRIHMSDQRPEAAIPILYIVTSNKQISKQLRSIQQKLRPLLLHSEDVSLDREITGVIKQQQRLQSIQQRHSLEKQSTEIDKSTLEVNPSDRDIYRKLHDLEKKLIELKPDSEVQNKLEDILRVIDRANEQLYESMKDSISISKMMRMKIVEILFYKKLAISSLKISSPVQTQSEVLKVLSHRSHPQSNGALLRLKDQLNHESVKLIRRLLSSVDAEKDLESLVSYSSPKELESLKALQKMKLQQLVMTEKLDALSKPSSPQQTQPSLDDIINNLNSIPKVLAEGMAHAQQDEQKSTAGPVALRGLRVLSRQLHNIQRVRMLLRAKVLQAVTTNGDFEKEEMQLKAVEGQKRDLIAHIIAIEESSLPTRESEQPQPLSQLKQVVQLEAKQLRLQAIVRDVRECLENFGQSSPDDSESLRCKKQIYDVITQASHIQETLDIMRPPMQSQPQHSLLDVLLKKQSKQISSIRKVEEKLKQKADIDTSLLQPLQTLQQLKDKAQRSENKVQSLKQKSPPSTVPAVQSTSGKVFNKPFKFTLTVAVGTEAQSKLHVLIIGKKSLEQLLWEKDQAKPGKQDSLVRTYLQDSQTKDDRTATGYPDLKDELNLYRHIHTIASYEDAHETFQMGVRAWFWRLQEKMKAFYYDKVTLIMPDKTNLPNTASMKWDLKRGNKWSDVEVKTPYETNRVKNMVYSSFCPVLSLNEPFIDQIIRSITGVRSAFKCEVSPDRIKTLRGSRYEVQKDHDKCEKVLAADCSSSDKLVILSNPSQQQLKVLIPGHKIEVSAQSTGDVEVVVDGSRRQLQSKLVIGSKAQIKKLSKSSVEVRLEYLGISVITDGKKHTIKVSRVPRLRLCGLCGDPLSSAVTDLVDPHQVPLSQHPDTLQSTYLLPSSSCDAQALKQQNGVAQIRKQAKLVKPVEKTLVHIQDKEGKTCFSKVPVKSCPQGSKPESTNSVLVPFHCLRSKNPQVAKIQQLAKTQVIDNYRYRRTSVNLYKPEPTDCIKQ